MSTSWKGSDTTELSEVRIPVEILRNNVPLDGMGNVLEVFLDPIPKSSKDVAGNRVVNNSAAA